MKTSLEDLAKIAFDELQSDMPLEYQMQYVPLFGEGFTAGWEAATHHVEYESRDSKLGKIKACLNYFELKNLTIDDAERFWNAAIFNAIDRLNEKVGDGNGDVSGD